MPFIQPKNWAEFQHYKDRSPAWIKLHRSILDNYEYQCLPLASRALAPMLWLLASEYEGGKIPADLNRIAFRIRVSVKELEDALNPLISTGFFVCYQDDSEALAVSLPREEVEEEEEIEKKKPSSPADAVDPCPHQSIIDLYHEILPMMPRIKDWNASRQSKLRARWREDAERQSLDWWRSFFTDVSKSDFLCGRVPGRDGGAPFMASLEWLVTPNKFAKVIEGQYRGRPMAQVHQIPSAPPQRRQL